MVQLVSSMTCYVYCHLSSLAAYLVCLFVFYLSNRVCIAALLTTLYSSLYLSYFQIAMTMLLLSVDSNVL